LLLIAPRLTLQVRFGSVAYTVSAGSNASMKASLTPRTILISSVV